MSCFILCFFINHEHYHPAYNRYFIPYLGYIKEDGKGVRFLSPMAVDWPRFWRGNARFRDLPITECIDRMNTTPSFASYYDGAIKFAAFSQAHENWPDEINREGVTDIVDYYEQVKARYCAL